MTCRWKSVAKCDALARFGGLGRAQQAFDLGVELAIVLGGARLDKGQRREQKELHAPARVLGAVDARGQDLGVVGHHERAFGDEVGKVGEGGGAQALGGAVEHHEARTVAVVGGLLGYVFLGQLVIVRSQTKIFGYSSHDYVDGGAGSWFVGAVRGLVRARVNAPEKLRFQPSSGMLPGQLRHLARDASRGS